MADADRDEEVPSANASFPIPRNPRYQTLDPWRGLACLMIVVLHATLNAKNSPETVNAIGTMILSVISRMGVGVPIFFVISGYCIAATSDSIRRKPKASTQFFYRRFRRIFPPYWAVAILSILLQVILTRGSHLDLSDIPNPLTLSLSQWLGNITLTETWRAHVIGSPELKIVGPSWTLCYEEQFYAVCGLLIVIAPRHFFTGIAIVTLLTLALMPFWGNGIEGFFFDGRWLMFAEGIAVYYLLNYTQTRKRGVYLFVLLLCITVALRWGIPAVATDDFWRNRLWELVASTTFALTIIFLRPWDHQIANAQVLRPIALCGQMCYSLYLVHWPVTIVLTNVLYRLGVRSVWQTLLIAAPITMTASIAASWIFYLIVERRFINALMMPTAPNLGVYFNG